MSKGRKPARPQSKKVAALLKELQRQKNARALSKRFLIVCEDDKSAPNYFLALKRYFSLSATSVEVIGSGGHTQPLQVVERPIEIKERAKKEDSSTEPFDPAWCIIDGDYGAKIVNARAKARANEIDLAVSTMCFEYWVLLHFEERAEPAEDCDAVIRSLKAEHLPDYSKGAYEFSQIMKNIQDACERAERLRNPGIKRGELPENQNPCSEVCKLVNRILES